MPRADGSPVGVEKKGGEGTDGRGGVRREGRGGRDSGGGGGRFREHEDASSVGAEDSGT